MSFATTVPALIAVDVGYPNRVVIPIQTERGAGDYIFSVIKKFRQNSNFVLPDRSAVTMTVPFMDAYVKLLIKTCHKRGVHAMVSIPISMREIPH